MRKVLILGMGGLVVGLMVLIPPHAWGEGVGADTGTQVAQGRLRERLQEGIERRGGGSREARRQDAAEWQQAWQALSPEDRAALTQAWRDASDRIKNLTPEEKQRLKQAAGRVAEGLKNLSPEQKAKLQERLQKSAQNYAALTAEQKQEILTHLADKIERNGKLSQEQKDKLKGNFQKLLGM